VLTVLWLIAVTRGFHYALLRCVQKNRTLYGFHDKIAWYLNRNQFEQTC